MPKKITPMSGGQSVQPRIERDKARPNGNADVIMHCGIPLQNMDTKTQWRGECPFCGKADHFYISSQTGLWDCKVCQESGNVWTFIRKFYAMVCTPDSERIQALADIRGIDPEILESELSVRWNPIAAEYVIPTFNDKGEVSNIYHWRNIGDKRQLSGLPLINRGIFGFPEFWAAVRAVPRNEEIRFWVMEGPWDKAAMRQILAESYGKDNVGHHIIVGTSGSSGLPEDMITKFDNCRVRACFDNDAAGLQMLKRLSSRLAANHIVPMQKEALAFHWPAGFSEGYDFNDLLRDKGSASAVKLISGKTSQLRQMKIEVDKDTIPGYDPNVVPVKCESYQELEQCVNEVIKMNGPMRQTWLWMVAMFYSLWLGDCMLWGFVVGATGSGKSSLINILAGLYNWAFSVDKFTGFFSGYQAGGKDPSILAKCNKKVFLIQDFTGTLGDSEVFKRVKGEQRAVYEGSAAAYYRNMQSFNWDDIYFPTIAGVTNAIRNHNDSDMGERFTLMEIDREWNGSVSTIHDNSESAMKSIASSLIQNMIDRPIDAEPKYIEQKCMLWGFMDFLKHYWTPETRTDAILESGFHTDSFLTSLAKIVAISRSIVERGRDGELEFRPRAVQPTRFYRQFLKTSIAMYLVLRPTLPPEEAKRLVCLTIYKQAMDTAFGWPLEILLSIGNGVNTLDDLVAKIGISKTRVHGHVKNLLDLEVLEETPIVGAGPGRPTMKYQLIDVYDQCFKDVLAVVAGTAGTSQKLGVVG